METLVVLHGDDKTVWLLPLQPDRLVVFPLLSTFIDSCWLALAVNSLGCPNCNRLRHV
ncbi:hypothetical protein RISK_002692 [Rhodopirellula islandica]|uniref:Uncharacterized protein n=1 Tax=Rhodopirellula islandica TaxID=595434 RepID=A0A0J1EII3_RHOIS|nr:hypothetical protein RISK_002692 [Rhodopirellula islandica]